MFVRAIQDDDIVNYKVPSMFIALGHCNWKCCKEANIPVSVCQNSELANAPSIEISYQDIYNRYNRSKLTAAIVIGGLEPMTMSGKIIELIDYFRSQGCNDTFVIYTGYYLNEIPAIITQLQKYSNIIIKFGRFVPNQPKHYDEVLGVDLASPNQYAKQIS